MTMTCCEVLERRKHLKEEDIPFEIPEERFHFHVATGRFVPPEKAQKGGEDASFTTSLALGVFDGISEWNARGYDPGLHSEELARLTACEVSRNGPEAIVDALETAARKNDEIGTSTVSLASLVNKKLIGYNLGDSGFLVIRDGDIFYETPEQDSEKYHCPYQVGTGSKYSVEDGLVHTFQVRDGDWVIMGTNGVWDNLYSEDVRDVVNQYDCGKFSDVDRIAEKLVRKATKKMDDKCVTTPFTEKARRHGKHRPGGQVDEVTVICALVTDRCHRGSVCFRSRNC